MDLNNNFSSSQVPSSDKIKAEEQTLTVFDYDNLLYKKETEVRELSAQMGLANEKYFNTVEKMHELNAENESLKTKIIKQEETLKCEVKNMEIMRERIEKVTEENKELRKKVNGKLNGENERLKDKVENNNELLSENIKYEPLFK